jgi:hypothetical protein
MLLKDLTCVPKICTFICINLEPLFFAASLALTRQLKTQKIKAQDHGLGLVAGTNLSSASTHWSSTGPP